MRSARPPAATAEIQILRRGTEEVVAIQITGGGGELGGDLELGGGAFFLFSPLLLPTALPFFFWMLLLTADNLREGASPLTAQAKAEMCPGDLFSTSSKKCSFMRQIAFFRPFSRLRTI